MDKEFGNLISELEEFYNTKKLGFLSITFLNTKFSNIKFSMSNSEIDESKLDRLKIHLSKYKFFCDISSVTVDNDSKKTVIVISVYSNQLLSNKIREDAAVFMANKLNWRFIEIRTTIAYFEYAPHYSN